MKISFLLLWVGVVLFATGISLFEEVSAAQVGLTISQDVNRDAVSVGDNVAVTLSLDNTGSAPTNISVSTSLPDGITPIANVPGDTTPWEGTLGPGKTNTLEYTVHAGKQGNHTITSSVRYTDSNGTWNVMHLTSEVSAGNQKTISSDSDGDGWSDEQEENAGTDPTKVDTDSDGTWDPHDEEPLRPPPMPRLIAPLFIAALTLIGMIIVLKSRNSGGV